MGVDPNHRTGGLSRGAALAAVGRDGRWIRGSAAYSSNVELRRAMGSIVAAVCVVLGVACCAPPFGAGDPDSDLPLPSSARLLREEDGDQDFQGDAERWAVYAIPRGALRRMRETVLWWMREGAPKWPGRAPASAERSPRVVWRCGRLPRELREAIEHGSRSALWRVSDAHDVCYADKRVEGGWERIVVTDSARGRLYYHRSTW